MESTAPCPRHLSLDCGCGIAQLPHHIAGNHLDYPQSHHGYPDSLVSDTTSTLAHTVEADRNSNHESVDTVSVSISTTFPPVSRYGPVPPDVIIISSDQVYFRVHLWALLAVSGNNFDSYLSEETIGRRPTAPRDNPFSIALDEESSVIDLMLRAIYNLSYIDHSPSVNTAVAAINALKRYGVVLYTCIARGTLLHRLLIGLAPFHPLEMFAVAAENHLEDLAVDVSSFLLAYKPQEIPDELVYRIGPLYLKRLFALHEKRLTSFRDIIAAPPPRHPPDARCTPSDVQGVVRTWLIAIAQLVMEYRPDAPPFIFRSTLGTLGEQVSCEACKQSLAARVDEIVEAWSQAKRTI